MFSKNIEVIVSKSPEGLRDTLKSIRLPFSVETIYFDGKNHIAWIYPDRPFSTKFRKLLKMREQN